MRRSSVSGYGHVANLLLLGFALAACEQPPADRTAVVRDVGRIDTVQLPDSVVMPLAESSYDPALGALLVLPFGGMGMGGGTNGSADVALLSPMLSPDLPINDTTGLRSRLGDGVVTVLSREGRVGDFVVALDFSGFAGDAATDMSASASVCSSWPRGHLLPVPGDSAARAVSGVPVASGAWTVAFPAGRVISVPLEPIEKLPSRDSAMSAAAFARLASALPADSTSAFRGLPFTVTRAYRTTGLASGYAVGVLVRRVPQEDSPLEERLTMLVAMSSPDPRRWTLEWTERFAGREEEVIATEALAMVRTGADDHLALLLGRDDGIGTMVSLLERRDGRWVVRWESPVSGC